MVVLLIVTGRALALALRGHRELVLENLALRQQLTAMKRTINRPHLQTRDRLFWIALTRIWRNWRSAMVVLRQYSDRLRITTQTCQLQTEYVSRSDDARTDRDRGHATVSRGQ